MTKADALDPPYMSVSPFGEKTKSQISRMEDMEAIEEEAEEEAEGRKGRKEESEEPAGRKG